MANDFGGIFRDWAVDEGSGARAQNVTDATVRVATPVRLPEAGGPPMRSPWGAEGERPCEAAGSKLIAS